MPAAPRDEQFSDSWEIVAQAAAAGDGPAFERLYRRFERGISHFFERRIGAKPEAAAELSQQTWVEVYRSLIAGNYDPTRSRFSTYAYAVAYNTWLQHRRRTGRISSQTDLGELDTQFEFLSSDMEAGPHAVTAAAERIDAVRDCLWESAGLTDGERDIIIELNDAASERSLAERLGIAASTVHARKQSALDKLRRCLTAKGFSAGDFERDRG
jgi:RNA polymerase sigma-70 factor (ECF subfamily)